ncbi:tetratricopeptide repeat protein [Pseudoalteromonas sp. SIMBA_153]
MRFFLLFVFLWGLTSTAFATTSPNSTPVNSAPIIANTQNSQDLMYQQLFSMQSQLVRLDEKLQQQKSLSNDFKTLEAAQQALKVQLTNLQTKLEAQEKLQTNQLNGVDGRISDIASNTNMWGLALTIFGLIITVAAIALGFSAKNRAVYEAKQAANIASESHMEKWLLDNKGKLISETKVELEKVSLELKERAEKLATEASAALNKIERDLIEESKRIITSKKGETGKDLGKHNKPSTRASAKNWFKVGLSAFEKSEYDEALKAWAKVLQLLDQKEEPELYAVTLVNQGITYGQQDKLEDALSSFKTLIEQFKASPNEEIQVQVAMAMYNQGVAYGQQDKLEDALSSFKTLIEQFKDSSNEEIQKNIASSRANIAEQALLYETPEQVLSRVAEAEKYSEDPQLLAVMQFIRFLLDDKSIEEVFTALTKIPTEMNLTWNFGEIKDYLTDNFEGIKQQQIQAVVQYFEQHKDIEQLRVELGIKG